MKNILVALFVLFSSAAVAQNFYVSPYSYYGVGMLNDKTSSLNRSLAGTGIAIRDERNLNLANPASYSSIAPPVSHIFEAGFYTERNTLENSKHTESKSNGGMNSLLYWFRFSSRWSSVVGLSPYSSVSYNISTTQAFSTSDANYRYEGSGNINRLYWGHAYKIKNFSIGMNLSYLFGTIKKYESIEASASTDLLTLERKIFTNKFDVDFGAQYVIPVGKSAVVLGVVADDGLKLSGREKYLLTDANGDTLDNSNGAKKHYALPKSIGGGVALQTSRYILSTDLRYNAWGSASYADANSVLQDTWRFSAGYVYKGNPDAESYWGLIGLRAGVYYTQFQQRIKSTTLPYWGWSAGVSLPLFDGKSAVNLSYSFDKLGTLDNNLILQRTGRVSVDVIIRDLWGIRRKFD